MTPKARSTDTSGTSMRDPGYPGAESLPTTPWESMSVGEALTLIASMSSATAAGDAVAVSAAVDAVVDAGAALLLGFGVYSSSEVEGRAARASHDTSLRGAQQIGDQAREGAPKGAAVASSATALGATQDTRPKLQAIAQTLRERTSMAPTVRAAFVQMMTSTYSDPMVDAATVLGPPPKKDMSSSAHMTMLQQGANPSGGNPSGADPSSAGFAGDNGDGVDPGDGEQDISQDAPPGTAGQPTVVAEDADGGPGAAGSEAAAQLVSGLAGEMSGPAQEALNALGEGLTGTEAQNQGAGIDDDGANSQDASTTDTQLGSNGRDGNEASPVAGLGAGGLGGPGTGSGPGLAPPRPPTVAVPAGAMPGGPTGAAPPAARLPPMMPPLAPAARGSQASDASHRSADYLHRRENGAEVVGDLPLVGPPVVGDWQAPDTEVAGGLQSEFTAGAEQAPSADTDSQDTPRRLAEPEWFSLNLPPAPSADPTAPSAAKRRDGSES